jgi:hypothetical protein
MLTLLSLLATGELADRAAAQGIPAPQTTAPSGDYQSALLKLDKAWDDDADLPLFLSFREGKGAAVWCVAAPRKDAHRLWIDSNSLRVAGGKLTGEVQGRMVKHWGTIAEVGSYQIQLTATLVGDKVTGSYHGKFGPAAVRGNLAGTLASEDQLRKENAFPAGKDWPSTPSTGSSLPLRQARRLGSDARGDEARPLHGHRPCGGRGWHCRINQA